MIIGECLAYWQTEMSSLQLSL